LTSTDGRTWTLANDGLGLLPGTRLHVDALAADPAQLDVLYAAISYLNGSTQVHQSPVGVTMSTNGGASWSGLANNSAQVVTELLPVAGSTGAVYALTTTSRTPQALGKATVIAQPAEAAAVTTATAFLTTSMAAWVIAGLAAAALVFALVYDAARRSKRPVATLRLQARPVSSNR
jgi:hypothetical protein